VRYKTVPNNNCHSGLLSSLLDVSKQN